MKITIITGKHLDKEFYYNHRTHTYSSTELRKRIENRKKGYNVL